MKTGRWALLFFSSLAIAVHAQQYQPKNITFSGYQDASASELLAISGLKKGAVLSQTDVQAAAQRLNETGLFAKITFRADPSELRFDLVPADGLAPGKYENFPWWTDSEITTSLRAAIPIFHGAVPPESGLEQQISSDLVKLIASKNITSIVESAPQSALGSTKISAIQFRIASPPVVLGVTTIAGVSAANEADVAAIAKAAAGEAYSENGTLATLNQALKNAYHERGFLELTTSNFTHKDASEQEGKIVVPIGLTVSEGLQYRVGKFTLSGDILMSKDEFEKRAQLHPGDIANESKLRNTLFLIGSPYKTRGYLRARIAAEPVFHHDTPATVDYAISVTPGDVFHMGALTLENLTDAQKAQFLKVWKMAAGDVYDASYPPPFLKKNADALHSLDGLTAGYKQFEHEDTHVVDLVVTFRKLNN
jgi:outer membrane protein assembly factor BamA